MKVLLGLFAVLVLSASSCSTINSVATAQTPQQKAYAIYGTFVVFEEQAAMVVANPNLPPAALSAIKTADAKAKPVADSLLAATQTVLMVNSQLAAGKTTADKLTIANSELANWVTQATPLVNDLITAVEGAKAP